MSVIHFTLKARQNLKKLSLKLHHIEKSNSVDPDEVAHFDLPHLDLHCLEIQLFKFLVLYMLMKFLM